MHGVVHEVRDRVNRFMADVRWSTGRLRIGGRTGRGRGLVHIGQVGIGIGPELDERGDTGVGRARNNTSGRECDDQIEVRRGRRLRLQNSQLQIWRIELGRVNGAWAYGRR